MFDPPTPLPTTNGIPVLEKGNCVECFHHHVCIYRIQDQEPGKRQRRAQVFGTVVNIVECEHYHQK